MTIKKFVKYCLSKKKSLLNTNTSPSKWLTGKHLVQVKKVSVDTLHFESKAFITFLVGDRDRTNSSSSSSPLQRIADFRRAKMQKQQKRRRNGYASSRCDSISP